MQSIEVKERPILFSGPMVRAILDGRKTQTRRIVKPQPETINEDWEDSPTEFMKTEHHRPVFADTYCRHYCPYGRPGDRLWVRETWCPLRDNHYHDGLPARHMLTHRSDGRPIRAGAEYRADGSENDEQRRCMSELHYKWTPSIHMPRWASRLTLEITGVRVERLQEVSEGDAIAEGWPRQSDPGIDTGGNGGPFDWFRLVWESINGTPCKRCRGHGVVTAWVGSSNGTGVALDSEDCPECHGDPPAKSWAANPWVWVIEFQKVEE